MITDLTFHNQLKNQELVKNCGPESIFHELCIFWLLGVYHSIIYIKKLYVEFNIILKIKILILASRIN